MLKVQRHECAAKQRKVDVGGDGMNSMICLLLSQKCVVVEETTFTRKYCFHRSKIIGVGTQTQI